MSHPAGAAASSPFEIGAVCRPLFANDVSGDAWCAVAERECLTLVIADGVGHGAPANEASTKALACIREALEHEPLTPLDRLMRRCHDALRGTRGAAAAICRLDPRSGKASYCGVGNTSLQRHPHRKGLGVSLPGTLGCMMRSVRTFDTELLPGDVYVFHTDGVSASIALDGYSTLPMQRAADEAIQAHGKIIDDATVVFLRYRP